MKTLIVSILVLLPHYLANGAAPPDCKSAVALFQAQGIPEEQWPICEAEIRKPSPPLPNLPKNEICTCTSKSVRTCKYTLTGYPVGGEHHPEIYAFSKKITYILSKARIVRVEIQGYADGTSDALGAGKWENVTTKPCRKEASGIFYDLQLAELRRCVLRQYIENHSGQPLSIAPVETQYDFPTSIETASPQHRKVEIKVSEFGSCNKD